MPVQFISSLTLEFCIVDLNQTPDVLGIRSLGALSVDDDLMIDGKTLSRAIRVWRAYPTRLVGFDFTARGIRRVDTIPFDGTFRMQIPCNYHFCFKFAVRLTALPEDLPPNASHAYIHSKAVVHC